MSERSKAKKINAIIVAALLLSAAISVFFQGREEASLMSRSLSANVPYASSAELNVHNSVNEDAGSEEKEERNSPSSLLFLLSSVLAFNGAVGSLLLVASPISIVTGCDPDEIRKRHALKGVMSRYRMRCLKFLSPVQKSLLCRADEYDINPLTVFPGEENPCFASRRARVFFMGAQS